MQQDFNKMMRDAQKSIQKMQQDMAQMQADLKTMTIEGKSGGGAVIVSCNGQAEFTAIKIQKDVVDPNDVETLEDLVLTAVRDASQKTQALITEKTGKITNGLNLPPGLGF